MARNGESDSSDGTESSEWVELAREIRASDPAIHAQALRTVRGIAAALRARKGAAGPGAAWSFGASKGKPSA